MKKRLASSFALALTAAGASAQGWVAELDSNRNVRAIRRAADGDIVLVGNEVPGGASVITNVRKFTPAGSAVAAFDIGAPGMTNAIAQDAVTTAGGDVVVCGSAGEVGLSEYAWVSAWDLTTGAKLWQTTTAEPTSRFDAITAVPGGYVAVGVSYASTHSVAFAAGFDDAGSLLWQRTYDAALIGRFLDVTSTGDGGAAIVGLLDFERFLIRIDPAGNPVWSRRIHLAGSAAMSVTRATNGNLFVTTTAWDINDPWISSWSVSGDLLWQRDFNTAVGMRPRSLEPAPDGGAYMFGAYGDEPTIMRIDANGALFWHRLITLSDEYLTGGVLPTPEGGCFVGCSQEDAGVERSYLARLGAYGDWAGSCTGTLSSIWTHGSAANRTITPESVLTGIVAGESTVAGVESSPSTTFASVVCGDVCSNPPEFCSSLPNSVGSGSRIGSSGTTSVFANDLVLEARYLPAGTFGIFFYGTQPSAFPLGEGVVCVGGATFRLPIVQSNAMGVSQHALDLSVPPNPAGQIAPGATYYFQLWYRDVAGGPAGFNFSTGLAATFCP